MNADAIASMTSPFVAVFSALIAFVAGYIGWRKWRDEALRKDHVLAWVNETISALQSVALTCQFADSHLDEDNFNRKLHELMFSTSILVERGRMFFTNSIVDGFGAEKESAYRGYRPIILDPIVVAHQIAREWTRSDDDERAELRKLAEVCVKKFVSLAQPEVGRVRTAFAGSKVAGDGVSVEALLGDTGFCKEWTRPVDPEGVRVFLNLLSRALQSATG